MANLVDFYPDDSSVASFAGFVYKVQNKYDEAERAYLRALELVPDRDTEPNAVIDSTKIKGSIEQVRASRKAAAEQE